MPLHRVMRRCLALLLLGMTACGGAMLPPPIRPGNDEAFVSVPAPDLPGLGSDPAEPYVILPGDVLHLRTVSVEPLDAPDIVVDSAGFAHLPLGGEVQLGGLSLGEAERRCEQLVRRFDRFAHATLAVSDAGGHRISVVGAVAKPGVYALRPDVRIADALALAGGPSTFDAEGEQLDAADLESARVVREGVVLPIALPRALQGDPRHNVRVRAKDLIYIPASRGRRITVLGSVNTPRSVPFRAGMRLTEALAKSGGINQDADQGDVRIVRGSLARPRIYTTSLRDLVGGRGTDVELAAGDVVFVTEHWLATTSNVMSRLTPFLAATALGVALRK
jgi:polysaccharide export outer membrane protein